MRGLAFVRGSRETYSTDIMQTGSSSAIAAFQSAGTLENSRRGVDISVPRARL